MSLEEQQQAEVQETATKATKTTTTKKGAGKAIKPPAPSASNGSGQQASAEIDGRVKMVLNDEPRREDSREATQTAKEKNQIALATQAETLAKDIQAGANQGIVQANRKWGAFITGYSDTNARNAQVVADNLNKLNEMAGDALSRIAPELSSPEEFSGLGLGEGETADSFLPDLGLI